MSEIQKKIEWIEQQAEKNAQFHIETANILLAESRQLLALLLGGAGGALALLVSLIEKQAALWLLAGTGAVSVHLFIVAGVVILKCLWAQYLYPVHNTAENLLKVDAPLDTIRERELSSLQWRTDFNAARNDRIGLWLNRCRALASATPLLLLASAWVY